MKKLIFTFVFTLVFLSCTTYVRAFNPPDGSLTFTTDSRQVTMSTTAASPTLLFTKDSWIQKTFIINTSTFTIFIATGNVNFSTSTAPGIPASTIFSLDGVNAPWWGQLYGVSTETTTPPKISIIKTR